MPANYEHASWRRKTSSLLDDRDLNALGMLGISPSIPLGRRLWLLDAWLSYVWAARKTPEEKLSLRSKTPRRVFVKRIKP